MSKPTPPPNPLIPVPTPGVEPIYDPAFRYERRVVERDVVGVRPPQFPVVDTSDELSALHDGDFSEGDMAFVRNTATMYVLKPRGHKLAHSLCYALLGSPCQLHPECAFDLEMATACMLAERRRVGRPFPGANLAMGFPDGDVRGALSKLLAEREAAEEYSPITTVPFHRHPMMHWDVTSWPVDSSLPESEGYVIPQISAHITRPR